MDEDLGALGDELERAIASAIAQERNNGTARRHLTGVPSPTSEVPVSNEPVHSAIISDATIDHAAISESTKPRRRRRLIVGAAVGLVAVAGVGAAAAISALSADTVSKGLPGGSALFIGTQPSCTTTDHVVFECTLASVPTQEQVDDWTNAAELFVDDHKNIAGGCRGLDKAGLHWRCFAGQRAVEEQILATDLLGQYSPEPGRG